MPSTLHVPHTSIAASGIPPAHADLQMRRPRAVRERGQRDVDERQHLEKAVHVSLRLRHAAARLRVRDVVHCRRLVRERGERDRAHHRRVELEDRACDDPGTGLERHRDVRRRFARARVPVDRGRAMERPIDEGGHDPCGHEDIRKKSARQVGPARALVVLVAVLHDDDIPAISTAESTTAARMRRVPRAAGRSRRPRTRRRRRRGRTRAQPCRSAA